MKKRLIVIGWFTFVSIVCVLFYFIALIIRILTGLFDRRLVILQQFTCFWGAICVWIIPAWKIRTEGRENIRRGGAYVVVSNHQSLLDILVLFTLFFHFKFVSKIEIFKVPFIGWNMYLNRYIRLKRGDRASIAQMMADCEKTLAEGSSVLIFPEGTRSPDGNIKAFKPGAFVLAQKMKVPILPIVITGTNTALPKYSLDFHGSHLIRIKVLKEIPYEQFADLTTEGVSDLAREAMIRELAALKEETPAKADGAK